ncbi:HI0933 family flavoprotein [Clostridium thermobutyricum]|uniref:HI0933 family flavoprotein n=1 Tax=Clostridium thermobutyricum TaxID=29372 RepID=N9WGA9_9CLOT|nr:NAD(P)/FAD-dependent oxidoreductase [Clostridium thermobutyricum]ENZ02116.1 HI0933 family flavoprotein [Clostridium thermobutyricum]
MEKVIVVGGGPAGIMAALKASEKNEVILIERNNEIGKKLKLTGGGRCNITNNRDIDEMLQKVVTNKKFLYSAFYRFTNRDLLDYFSSKNLEYKVEYDQKVYTGSDKADDVIKTLLDDLKNKGVKILYNSKVSDLIVEEGKIKGVVINNIEVINGDKVIIATGGKSHPQTGSDGSMYDILEKYGHKIRPQYAALIPLVIKEDFMSKLQGISMKEVVMRAKVKKKKFEQMGDMIFTHFGISGPGVLKLSSYINKALENDDITLTLDFLSDKSREEIRNIIRSNPQKTVINNMKGLLPQNFLKQIISLCDLEEVKSAELKKKDENKLISMIKEMTITARETLTIKAAMVTSGGVSVKDINSSTLQSKIVKGLYLCGEVIDVDAETGGYNLQIAFSTGNLAGRLEE